MEQNKSKETEEIRINGSIAICTALVIGYILGRVGTNQIAIEAYGKGVSDTLNSIVFRR